MNMHYSLSTRSSWREVRHARLLPVSVKNARIVCRRRRLRVTPGKKLSYLVLLVRGSSAVWRSVPCGSVCSSKQSTVTPTLAQRRLPKAKHDWGHWPVQRRNHGPVYIYVGPWAEHTALVVCGHGLVTLSLTINETLKWLSSLPILMQKSFWWWQCSDRYIYTLPLPPPPYPLFSHPPRP